MILEVHSEAEAVNMSFAGKWITCRKFASLHKQNVFHRQLDHAAHPVYDDDLVNTHVLFRRKFFLDNTRATELGRRGDVVLPPAHRAGTGMAASGGRFVKEL